MDHNAHNASWSKCTWNYLQGQIIFILNTVVNNTHTGSNWRLSLNLLTWFIENESNGKICLVDDDGGGGGGGSGGGGGDGGDDDDDDDDDEVCKGVNDIKQIWPTDLNMRLKRKDIPLVHC